MRLTVLSVAYPLAPIGSDAVGGAEQIMTALDRALVEAGHRSIVLACEGSVAAGLLHEIPASGNRPLTGDLHAAAQENVRTAMAHLLASYPIDVVHMHGIDFAGYLPPPGVPVLATLHLPPQWYPREVFFLDRPSTYLNCVSRAEEAYCPPGARLLPSVENGVPVENSPGPHAKRRFALALGRICPEKGFHFALEAAAKAGNQLLLAGQLFRYETHERYFLQEIAPRLDHRRRFIGAVGFKRKQRLLAAARCLLVPSLAPETSSLVAMEALACGTPVIAFRAGALVDMIEHGKTGFLVENADEMAGAIAAADSIDPEACRAAARRRFSVNRMTAQYLQCYEQLARGRASTWNRNCRVEENSPCFP